MVFESNVDWWYYLLLGVLALVVIAVVAIRARQQRFSFVPMVILAVIVLVLPLWLLFSTRYTVDGGVLEIQSGPRSWTIPLKDIHSVKRSRSSRSSPALSLDRIEIRYGNGGAILVSPENESEFVEALGHTIAE